MLRCIRRRSKNLTMKNKPKFDCAVLSRVVFMSIVFMLLTSFQSKIYVNAGSGTSDCPAECSCSSSGVVVDCSNRGLTKIPSPLPKDTVTL